MIMHGRISEATSEFQRYVHQLDYPELRQSARRLAAVALEHRDAYFARHTVPSAYLQTYLDDWVSEGGGVEWTGHDFTIYSRTVLNIIDCVMRGVVNCDYRGEEPYEREIVGIHNPDGDSYDSLEPTGYTVAAYRWDRRRSGLLVQEPIRPIA